MRHRPQVLAGVVVVQPLLGLAKSVCRQIPNPHGTIGYDQHFGGLRQAVSLCLGIKLFTQRIHPATGHHSASTQYLRPPTFAFRPLV